MRDTAGEGGRGEMRGVGDSSVLGLIVFGVTA